MSSSLELDTVLTTIVSRAVRLRAAGGRDLRVRRSLAEEFHLRATEGLPRSTSSWSRAGAARGRRLGRIAVAAEPWRSRTLRRPGAYEPHEERCSAPAPRAPGRAASPRRPGARQPHRDAARPVGAFGPEVVVRLLQTFATQSALAIRTPACSASSTSPAGTSRSSSPACRTSSGTPLNAIIGYSEMLQEDAADLGQEALTSPTSRRSTRRGKHLLELINAVLRPVEDRGRTDGSLPRGVQRAAQLVEDIAGIASGRSPTRTATASRSSCDPGGRRDAAPTSPRCARRCSTCCPTRASSPSTGRCRSPCDREAGADGRRRDRVRR